MSIHSSSFDSALAREDGASALSLLEAGVQVELLFCFCHDFKILNTFIIQIDWKRSHLLEDATRTQHAPLVSSLIAGGARVTFGALCVALVIGERI